MKINYKPQPKQQLLHRCPANEILYGGSAGPGKSHGLRQDGLIWSVRIPNLHVYLFRRTFPELEKNHILKSLEEFPQDLGRYVRQARRWEFINGSMLHFCHAQHELDVFAYQGAEIHLLLIDELTTFSEFQYDYLRGRVRCAMPIPEKYRHKIPGIICGSNPGGVGHEFVKRRWVDFCELKGKEPKEHAKAGRPVYFRVTPEKEKRYFGLKKAINREGGMVRAYIPGRLEDNPILTVNDPLYIHRLDALPEPYRTAYKEGDWDIFLGQAFHFSKDHHVIQPREVPGWAQIYMTYDWGFGAPFSIGWWWVDGDGRVYRFAEWYGWNRTPNQGLRLADSQVADGIKQREDQLGLTNRKIIRLSGHDCFAKPPDRKGGGQGPSTAEVFAQKEIFLSPGDPSRLLKIRQFRERLILRDEGPPMMQVYDTCTEFIRTIPLLQTDLNNVEDVDTNGEDHCYDEAALIAMARPISLMPSVRRSLTDKRIDHLVSDKGDYDIHEEGALITESRMISDMDEDEGLFEPEFESGIEPGDELKYDVE